MPCNAPSGQKIKTPNFPRALPWAVLFSPFRAAERATGYAHLASFQDLQRENLAVLRLDQAQQSSSRGTPRPGQHLLKGSCVYWLREVMVEARIQRAPFVLFLSPASQCTENQGFAPGLLPNSLSGFVTIEIRHSDVQKHHLWSKCLGQFHCGLAVMNRANLVAHQRQHHGEA